MVRKTALALFGLLALCGSSLHATVAISAFTPALASPQFVGTAVVWTATATDTNAGPLTFQYSVAYGSGPFQMVRDFAPGTLVSPTWTGPSFSWLSTFADGGYQVKVVAKDFVSGETATTTVAYTLKPISTGGHLVVTATSNPLVALVSAPSCPTTSGIRLTITKVGGSLVSKTNWQACQAPSTTNIFAAGMYPSTTYSINYQTVTGGTVTTYPTPVIFATGPLPTSITFPTFTVNVPTTSTDDAEQTVLHAFLAFGTSTTFLPIATDRNGNVLWYYTSPDPTHSSLLTRPLTGGQMLTIQSGNAWNPAILAGGQYLREIDLSGNVLRETNIGVLQQQALAMGAADLGPCGAVPLPAAVGAACLGTMHHDAIRMPNGYTALITDVEKIFPPGTQGDTSGLNVDIIGDAILILDQNFQLKWYFETFQHASGAPQLDINRGAVLGETCLPGGGGGCPNLFLVGTPGVTADANDWLHENSLYYDAANGDILVSSRHQDWVYKIDYKNGAGTNNILWRLGLDGDFTFNNTNNDPYPWFSHQHDFAFENTTTGMVTLFDNGNTRVSPPPTGLGSGNSRGMSLTVNEPARKVTPILSQDLGYYGFALGSAQLLSNGNFWFQPGVVMPSNSSYSLEVTPTAGTVNGTVTYNLSTATSYRSWLMPNLYAPPAS